MPDEPPDVPTTVVRRFPPRRSAYVVREVTHLAVDLAVCVMVSVMLVILTRIDAVTHTHTEWKTDVLNRLSEQAARIGSIEAHVEHLRLRSEQAAAAAEQARESVPAVAEAAAEKAAERVVERVGAGDGR